MKSPKSVCRQRAHKCPSPNKMQHSGHGAHKPPTFFGASKMKQGSLVLTHGQSVAWRDKGKHRVEVLLKEVLLVHLVRLRFQESLH